MNLRWKQKGQGGQKSKKEFLPFFALLALFASLLRTLQSGQAIQLIVSVSLSPPPSFHRRSKPSPPDAGQLVGKSIGALIEGQVHIERSGEDVFARNEAPIAAVSAVVSAVAQHEVLAVGHFDRFTDAEFHVVIDLEIVSVGRPFDVVEDSNGLPTETISRS